MKNSHQNHIPQTTGWSNQVRDFGKFWEVLGRGSGETLQTTHKARNHGGTPNKTLKSSQYLSKTPTSAALYRPQAAVGIQYPWHPGGQNWRFSLQTSLFLTRPQVEVSRGVNSF